MTRVKISIGILCFLLGVSIFSAVWLNIRCRNLVLLTETAENFCSVGDNESAKKSVSELCSELYKFRRRAVVIVEKEKLAELCQVSARILPLIENDSDETTAELCELAELIDALRREETPYLSNIL